MEPRDRDAVYQRIYATVDSIPVGCVATYGQIAEEAGLPRRARLVGRALRDLAPGSQVPWHRVLNHKGEIAERGSPVSERAQATRLQREGVAIDARGRVPLRDHRWAPESREN